jgi:hypothetical protein
MKPDLIKISEIFLVPSSFLVAALGTGDSNAHRAAVSLLGMIVSALWLVCARDALAEQPDPDPGTTKSVHPRRTHILAWLPVVFMVGWLSSLIIHSALFRHPVPSA